MTATISKEQLYDFCTRCTEVALLCAIYADGEDQKEREWMQVLDTPNAPTWLSVPSMWMHKWLSGENRIVHKSHMISREQSNLGTATDFAMRCINNIIIGNRLSHISYFCIFAVRAAATKLRIDPSRLIANICEDIFLPMAKSLYPEEYKQNGI